ncbi:non-specific lipid-transfer protein-like [Sinocyclocheilus rhinocerous]|uniref:non-specific lipid-transfer protein-like n=1 Tax=Sinocyclocheilus rhinocerous TaxID=307959 RepID=UPI0007BA3293|nr:PREDICTED: non-specific lipid-transfer protein-like [Sinocyclocheilus rhinocerous]
MRVPHVSSSPRIQAVLTSSSSGLEGFKAHAVFQEISKKLHEDGEQFVKKIRGVFAFKVKDGPGGKEAIWIVDVKNGKGSVHNDAGILPGQTEDHRKHGHGNEASKPAAAAGQSQAVRGGASNKAGPQVAPPTEFTLLE